MTAQATEILLYEGSELHMCATPLGSYFALGGNRPEFVSPHTGLWRGYIGHWEIVDDRLYLRGLEGALTDGSQASLATVFPDARDKVFAHWFNGTLRIPKGRCLEYVHQGFFSTYEQDLLLKIERGSVVKKRLFYNKVALVDDTGPTVDQLARRARMEKRTQEFLSTHAAVRLAEKFERDENTVLALKQILVSSWWVSATDALEELLIRGATDRELGLANHIRGFWSQRPEFSRCLVQPEKQHSRQVSISWQTALTFVRACEDYPDINRLQENLIACNSEWSKREDLHDDFPCFPTYFNEIVRSCREGSLKPPRFKKSPPHQVGGVCQLISAYNNNEGDLKNFASRSNRLRSRK